MLSPSREPVRLAASVQSLISAIFGLLLVFNIWTPTTDQQGAIYLALAALISFVAPFVRRRVTPVAKLNSPTGN